MKWLQQQVHATNAVTGILMTNSTLNTMNDKKKKHVLIWSILPLAAYTICSVYYMIIIRPMLHQQDMDDHVRLNTITARHFNTLIWLISIATVIAGIVYFYFLFHILRLRDMTSWNKIGWAVFLTFFGAFGFPVFWYYQIKPEPQHVRLKPSID
jgi:hypothetical protein